MKTKRTIETYLQRAILRYAGFGLVSLAIILAFATFLLAREQASNSLEESAKAVAKAFHDRIIEGDIRSVEVQIRDLLQLQKNEVVKILKADRSVIYSPVGTEFALEHCPVAGLSCFGGYFGQIRIETPITMDKDGVEPFRYLYISKNVTLNWTYVLTVVSVFMLIYMALIAAFFRVSKAASVKLGAELNSWSELIKKNPKDASPRKEVPFNELSPLKDALEGLNAQIEKYEQTATDKAKVLLLRGIAHDLLTPVSQLELNLATLNLLVENPEHKELMNDMSDSLSRLSGIASQVKFLKENQTEEKAELVKTLSHEVRSLSENPMLTSKNLSIEFKAPSMEILSPFSKTDISRIIYNLVKNSADASSIGETILVSVASDKNSTVFSVEDSGAGIPKSNQDKVFDAEFTTKLGTGTGLGLAVVKHLCDSNSASIRLKSELNKGTKVSIQFSTAEVTHA